MKKLSLIFSMVFAAGMAMAQTNQSVINASGKDQIATVDQQGGYNTSNVTQSNKDNVTTVTQVNHLLVAGNSILSNVTQSGERNDATVSQIHDGSNPNQVGLIETVITQAGNDNEAIQNQGDNSNTGLLYASINQSGDDNFASQNQMKYRNSAYIDQSGKNNTAMQAQDASLLLEEEETSHYASINQSGDNNYAEQVQNGHSNTAIAVQSGNGNDSWQTQNAWKSVASVNQSESGKNNEATQTQNGALNKATITQASNGNIAIQIQTGGARRPGNADYAENNLAEIHQWGGNENEAYQTQTTPGDGADENYAGAWQNGSGNLATQTQVGGFNYSTVSQTGSGHEATLTQSMSITQP